MAREDDSAEAAYQQALALIEEARKAGERRISFDEAQFRALDRIPAEIAGIEGLVSLDLDKTRVHDLTPIRGLTGLQTLSLNRTGVSDLTALSGLTGLRTLSLTQTGVSDLTALSGLTGLQTLTLSQTGVSDLTALAGLTGLEYLSLTQTGASDLTALAGLTGLHALSLSQTGVSDLTALAGLTGLQTLWLDQTGVSDLSALAGLTGLRELSLDQTGVSDLTALAGLTGLQRLWLGQTRVSDLSALAGLTGLQTLTLTQTGVSDLRPLRRMSKLGQGGFGGLWFADTPAVRLDSTLARLAGIKDPQQRARDTVAYLNTLPPWPEPLPWLVQEDAGKTPPAPEQDPALPLIWGEKGFAFLARSIDSDPVTEAALQDLRDLLEDLRRKGNRHDDLYRLAGELQERSKGEVRELNMVRLHLSYQKLRRVYQSREQRGEKFDDETVGVLGSVLEIIPGVTMADPGVAELIKRQEAERLAVKPPDTLKAEDAVLTALQDDDAPFDPEVKDAAKTMLEPGHNDRLAATKGILARNAVVSVLRFLRYDPVGASLTVWAATTHGPTLLAYAQVMGADAYLWAQMVLAQAKAEVQLSIGVAREALSAGKLHMPRKRRPDSE